MKVSTLGIEVIGWASVQSVLRAMRVVESHWSHKRD